MEAQTRKCGILNSDGRIKDAEDQPEPLFVFGPDAGIASSFEKSSQSLMGKTANHETQRNLLRDRLQRVLRRHDRSIGSSRWFLKMKSRCSISIGLIAATMVGSVVVNIARTLLGIGICSGPSGINMFEKVAQ